MNRKIVKPPKEKKQVSKAPAPFKGVSTSKPSYAVHPEIKWRTIVEKPSWKEWKYTPLVQVWQACALSLDIEPYSINFYPLSWQTGPYADQLFEDESFQSENEKKEFKSRQRILLNNLNSKEKPLWFSPNPNRPNLGEVSLPEFAAWCSSVEWSIPKELAALAKKPEAATVVKSENQDTDSAQSKQGSEENSALYTATDAQNKDKKDALTIAGALLSEDRLRSDILDDVIARAIEKAESRKISKVWPELKTLAKNKEFPFNGKVENGKLFYYSYEEKLISIDKNALEKRIDRLKIKATNTPAKPR